MTLGPTPYAAYTYSYPHKMAHRPFPQPVPLADLWAAEPRDALFLYFHVPFCPVRCGYCNLFTVAAPPRELPRQYLDAVRRQAERMAGAIGNATFARMAVGGGTPTMFDAAGLDEIFATAKEMLGARPREIPVSVEVSPGTVTVEKLAVLRARGTDRVSIGVQTFDDREAAQLGRRQQRAEVEAALDMIRAVRFPTLNIDLMYGLPGQTPASWQDTLRAALAYQPEEIYLYPLYIRPLTGLQGRQLAQDDERLAACRTGRDLLLEAGYSQVSMRLFRAAHAGSEQGPPYRCQEDGMVGLGCGARSYTRSLHYSSPYAIGRPAALEILRQFIGRQAESFDAADHGFALDDEDQRRRFVILSLLLAEGLDRTVYCRRFGSESLEDLPQLGELETRGLAEITPERIRLTEAGLEWSDAIGPWLYSAKVRRLIEEYRLQ